MLWAAFCVNKELVGAHFWRAIDFKSLYSIVTPPLGMTEIIRHPDKFCKVIYGTLH